MKPTEKISQLEQELAQKQAQYLRALADYQNLERRTISQLENEKRSLLGRFFRDLIEIRADLDKATVFQKDPGLALVRQKFEQMFVKHAIEEIDPQNQPFNPETMECVQLVNGTKANLVVEVLEKGYRTKSELLKPAKVVVSQLEVAPKGDKENK